MSRKEQEKKKKKKREKARLTKAEKTNSAPSLEQAHPHLSHLSPPWQNFYQKVLQQIKG